MRKYAVALLLPALIALVASMQFQCSSPVSTEQDTLVYLNHPDTASYVGMGTCRKCHEGIYQTFIQTGMGQSIGLASRQKSVGVFGAAAQAIDEAGNFRYKAYWQNDSLYISEYRLDGTDTVFNHSQKIDWIIGSGQHTNSHLYSINGYLYQAPMTFYAQKKKWDLPPGFDNGNNYRFGRTIELECLSCHNSYPELVQGSINKYVSIPQGIDCERCHGPGSIHVQQKLAGNIVDTATQIDYTIVNPKKLPYDLQVDVCQRCHLQGNAVLKPGKGFTDFKPGMKLSNYMTVFQPVYTDDDQFIMASHAERLKASSCFIESNKRGLRVNKKNYTNAVLPNVNTSSLTCISCHDPHRSVRVTANVQFNNACRSCHNAKQSLNECTETILNRKKVADNCVGCHMPKSGSIDIPHVRITDHRIQVRGKKPINTSSEKIFLGLKPINGSNIDLETIAEAYLNYFEKFEQRKNCLDSAKSYLKRSKNKDQRHRDNLIHLSYLQHDAAGIRKMAKEIDPEELEDNWTAYRIGEAYAENGSKKETYAYFHRAIECSPYNLDMQEKFAGAAALVGKTTESIATYRFVLKENPLRPLSLCNLGFLYVQDNRLTEGLKLYDQALAVDPDFIPALLNKAVLFVQTGQTEKGRSLLEQVIRIDPKNQQAALLLRNL